MAARDDAVELMERMQHEFGIDMSGMEFSRHFDAEGTRGWPYAVALVVALPLSVLAMMVIGAVSGAVGVSLVPAGQPFMLFALVYAACFLLVGFSTTLLPHERARRRRKIPLTVQHLIDAARVRRWPIQCTEGRMQ